MGSPFGYRGQAWSSGTVPAPGRSKGDTGYKRIAAERQVHAHGSNYQSTSEERGVPGAGLMDNPRRTAVLSQCLPWPSGENLPDLQGEDKPKGTLLPLPGRDTEN